jgi:Family of unknown function (DUF6263)
MRITTNAGLLVATLAFVVVSIPATAFRQDVTLAYKWTKGETLRYRIDQTADTTMSGMPGMPEVTLNQVANQIFKLTVDDLTADGVVTLNQVFESMRMNFTTPAGKISIDSAAPNAAAAPPEQIAQKIFSALVGEPFTIVLAPSGKVEKIEGFTRLMDKMAASIPADPAAAAAFQQLKSGLNDGQMNAMFSQGFPQFPAKPIKPGDSWSNALTLPNPALGTTITTIGLTLVSTDGGTAKLAGKVKVEADPKGAPAPGMMGMKTELMTANGDSEMVFDVARGRLRTATTSITLPMSMSGTGPDGTPVNMKMNAKSVVKIELMDK